MTAIYPWIEDFDGRVESLLPAPAAIGDSLSVMLALASPWSVMESALQELAVASSTLEPQPRGCSRSRGSA